MAYNTSTRKAETRRITCSFGSLGYGVKLWSLLLSYLCINIRFLYVCTCAHKYTWASVTLHLTLQDRAFPWSWNSPFHLVWLACEAQDPLVFSASILDFCVSPYLTSFLLRCLCPSELFCCSSSAYIGIFRAECMGLGDLLEAHAWERVTLSQQLPVANYGSLWNTCHPCWYVI